MALRDIITKEDPLLRKKSRPVTDFGPRTGALIEDMFETVKAADGLGLAAPQVGILRRAVVIYDGEKFVDLINPVITARQGEVQRAEGCLSCPGEQGLVLRPQRVTVKAFDRNGAALENTYEDMAARAVCHECDHLDGVLFIDIATEMSDDDDEEEFEREDDAE